MLRFDIQCSSYGSTSQFRNCSADFQFIVTKGVNVSMHVLENAIKQAETDFDKGIQSSLTQNRASSHFVPYFVPPYGYSPAEE
jgi:hypothetical protein